MSVFANIEGLRQEEMVTELLRYLVTTLPEIREVFVQLLSDASLKGPFREASHFSCMTEFTTKDEQGDGRLDMLVTVDGAVIGIENKLYAAFQSNQPEKYQKSVEEVAAGLASIFRMEMMAQVYVICPQSRVEDIRKEMGAQRDFPILTWEAVMAKFDGVRQQITDPARTVILGEFLAYLREQLGFFPDYRQLYVHTRTDFEAGGTPLQKRFMRQLWRFLPGGGYRLSQGDTWVGYYFHEDLHPAEEGWCGFVKVERLKNGYDRKHEAELVLATTWEPPEYRDSASEYGLVPVNIDSQHWFRSGKPPVHAWLISYDETWDRAERWFHCFAPLQKRRADGAGAR